VVGNDTGGAIVQLPAVENQAPVARIALVSSDAFDNFLPGLTGKALVTAGKPAPVHLNAPARSPTSREPVTTGRPGYLSKTHLAS